MESAKKHLCMNCMHEMGEYEVCAFCGWSEGLPPREAYHLYPRTILNDRYEIGVTIGFGGFGIIYRAWDRMLGMQVAIKEYYPSGLVNRAPMEKKVVVYSGSRYDQFQQGKQRFLDEAQNMAKFGESRYIVNVIDFFEENGTAYIVMEYLNGISLKQHLIQLGRPLETQEMLDIIQPVIQALKAVHGEGIIHRDVSPDNIFILPDGRVKLIDFGAARLSRKEKEQGLSVVIKPGYAPPEQYRSRGGQSSYTDIYALGATIYRMITGKVPQESVDRMVRDELVPPAKLNSNIDKNLENTILTAMALDQELRFQSVGEMEAALLGQKKVKLPDAVKKQIRKRQKTIVAAAVLGVVLVAGAVTAAITYFVPNQRLTADKIEPCRITVAVPAYLSDEWQTLSEAAQLLEEESNGNITVELSRTMTEDANVCFAKTPADVGEDAVFLDRLVGSLYTSDFVLLDGKDRELADLNCIPTGFSMDMIYYNDALLTLYGLEVPYSENKEIYGQLETLEDYSEYVGEITEVEECDDMIFSVEYREKHGMEQDDGRFIPPDQFFSENQNAVMYIGDESDLRAVREGLPGFYAVGPMPLQDGAYPVDLCNCWYVRDVGTKNEQQAAMLYLGYLLSDRVQSQLYIAHQDCLPLRREILERFCSEKYPELNWIPDFMETAQAF